MAAVTTNASALEGVKLNNSSLSDGDCMTYDSASGTWKNATNLTTALAGKVSGSTKITVSSTAPSSPATNDLWVDTT